MRELRALVVVSGLWSSLAAAGGVQRLERLT
jgi:hypothetical protein